MKMKNTTKSTLSLAAAVAAAFTLAPVAQAGTVIQSSSADLNLTGRTVLAAVNFYDPNRIAEGQRTAGVIQGVDFDDFRVNVDDTGSAIPLSGGVAGATLSTVFQSGFGREWGSDPTALGFSGPDATEAENYVNGGINFEDSQTATLTFAFGASYALTDVEVQMPGGGVWNRNERDGKLVMSVDSGAGLVEVGELVDRGIPNYELLTFNATTDASGGLVIEVVNDWHELAPDTGQRQYAFLMGTTVTAAATTPAAITLENPTHVSGTPDTVTADIDAAGDVDIFRSATLENGSWGTAIETALTPGTGVVIDSDTGGAAKAFYIAVPTGESAP